MATTTNFGWETPDDTDLVKDGAAAMRTLGNSIDTSFVDLKGGTTGQVLSKASNTDLDYTWVTTDDANAIQNAIVDAKGDLIAATAADTPARLAVGTNGQILVADSTASTGLKWAASGNLVGCRITKTGSNQTISNNTATNLTFNAETYDTNGFHSTTVNPQTIIIPAGLAGYYHITGQVGWDTNATGRRIVTIKINSSTGIAIGEVGPTSGVYPAFGASTTYYLNAADTVEMEVFQTSGGNLDALVQADRTFLQIERIGS